MPKNTEQDPGKIRIRNTRILELAAGYLRKTPRFVSGEMVDSVSACGVDRETAYQLLVAGTWGLNPDTDPDDRILLEEDLPYVIRRLDPLQYEREPYFRLLKGMRFREGGWVLGEDTYAPYEAFVRDDLLCLDDGRILPQLGYFEQEFPYPAVYGNGMMWMSLTPNEISTMREPAGLAHGRVLVFGLGIGYYPYLCLQNPAVRSVTVVERDADCIRLFADHLLPVFPDRERVTLIEDDAFAFAEREFRPGAFDYVFTDLWLDVSDGLELSGRMKRMEARMPDAAYGYWIEKSLACYRTEPI